MHKIKINLNLASRIIRRMADESNLIYSKQVLIYSKQVMRSLKSQFLKQ